MSEERAEYATGAGVATESGLLHSLSQRTDLQISVKRVGAVSITVEYWGWEVVATAEGIRLDNGMHLSWEELAELKRAVQ